MKKIRIGLIVLLSIITAGLCAVLAYGMSGHDVHAGWGGLVTGTAKEAQLVLEQEIPLDGIERIVVSYARNGNDIYLYESESDHVVIREYSSLELREDERTVVTVGGGSIEVKGQKKRPRGFQYGIGYKGGHTQLWIPSSYAGAIELATSSGDILSEMDIALGAAFGASSVSGDIRMPQIMAASVSLGSTSGDIRTGDIDTAVSDDIGAIQISTTSGDIGVQQLTGTVDIGSVSGCVETERISGGASVSVTSGDILVQQIDGDAKISSTSGSIRLLAGDGDRTVMTISGDIMLTGGDNGLQVGTTSGEVIVSAHKGAGSISTTSGDIRLELQELGGSLDLDSSSGDVRMDIPRSSSFVFTAGTVSGGITTFFDEDLEFSKRRDHAQGSYGTDVQERSVQISTTSGDIWIQPQH